MILKITLANPAPLLAGGLPVPGALRKPYRSFVSSKPYSRYSFTVTIVYSSFFRSPRRRDRTPLPGDRRVQLGTAEPLAGYTWRRAHSALSTESMCNVLVHMYTRHGGGGPSGGIFIGLHSNSNSFTYQINSTAVGTARCTSFIHTHTRHAHGHAMATILRLRLSRPPSRKRKPPAPQYAGWAASPPLRNMPAASASERPLALARVLSVGTLSRDGAQEEGRTWRQEERG